MENNSNQQHQDELQNQTANVSNARKTPSQSGNGQDPANRLNDGTNDFQNGDQEPTSKQSSEGEKGS